MGEKSILGVGNRGRHSDTILAGSLYVLMMVHSWNEIRYKYRKIMRIILLHNIRLRANGRNIVDQQLPGLLDVTSCVRLHTLLHVVVQNFFCSVIAKGEQQCWIRLHSSSNIVGTTHAHYAWFTKTYGLYHSTMHCRYQHCWELLHSYADHCQHARNMRPFARSQMLQNKFFRNSNTLLRRV